MDRSGFEGDLDEFDDKFIAHRFFAHEWQGMFFPDQDGNRFTGLDETSTDPCAHYTT
jgi:hypothetical protein